MPPGRFFSEEEAVDPVETFDGSRWRGGGDFDADADGNVEADDRRRTVREDGVGNGSSECLYNDAEDEDAEKDAADGYRADNGGGCNEVVVETMPRSPRPWVSSSV